VPSLCSFLPKAQFYTLSVKDLIYSFCTQKDGKYSKIKQLQIFSLKTQTLLYTIYAATVYMSNAVLTGSIARRLE